MNKRFDYLNKRKRDYIFFIIIDKYKFILKSKLSQIMKSNSKVFYLNNINIFFIYKFQLKIKSLLSYFKYYLSIINSTFFNLLT